MNPLANSSPAFSRTSRLYSPSCTAPFSFSCHILTMPRIAGGGGKQECACGHAHSMAAGPGPFSTGPTRKIYAPDLMVPINFIYYLYFLLYMPSKSVARSWDRFQEFVNFLLSVLDLSPSPFSLSAIHSFSFICFFCFSSF